ncbi:MAG: outer membrane lipoprotein-sorting protein [bacterium]
MNKIFTAFLIVLLWISPAIALSPQDILEKADGVRAPFESFVMDIDLTSPDETMRFNTFSKGGEDTLVLYLMPKKEKGKLLLMKEEDLWIYIPGTRRALRITPMQKLMGGVSNGDITRLRWAKDYDAKLMGEEDTKYQLELLAQKKSATYYKMIVWIEKKSFKPIKAVVYLKSGKLYKTMYFIGFKTFSGKLMATDIKFIDHLKSEKETVMTFSKVIEKEVPDNYFNIAEVPRLSEILSDR